VSGTITDGVRIVGAGSKLVASDYIISALASVTDAVHVEDTPTIIMAGADFDAPVNCIHVIDDDATVDIRGFRFDASSYDVLVEAGVSSGKLHLVDGEMHSDRISAALAWYQNSDWLFDYHDDLLGDIARRIQGAELTVGHHMRGTESVFGEGDSHTIGMAALRNTNSEAGTWSDVTAAVASASGSTTDVFPGVTVGNAFFIGGDAPFPGLKGVFTGAIVLGTGAIDISYWNGASWVSVPLMASDADSPYTQYANTFSERVNTEQMRFGFDTSLWSTKNLNGITKYWLKIEVTTAITTSPVVEQMKIHTNRYEINKDGVFEWFGKARPVFTLPFFRTMLENDANAKAKNADVQWSTNITLDSLNNDYQDGNLMGAGGTIIIPEGLDTSFELSLRVGFYQGAAGTGDVELELTYTDARTIVGDLIDGTASDATLSQIVAASGTQYELQEVMFKIPVSDFVPGDRLTILLSRDAQGGNLDDTFAGNIVVTDIFLDGVAWRGA
jgi:hypothetical protein